MDSHETSILAVLKSWCRIRPRSAPQVARLDQDGWERLAQTARHQGVAGLVHRAAALDPAADLIPGRIRAELRQTARDQAAAHAWQEAALQEVLDAFDRQGLIPVLLRGHALVANLYEGDGSLRPQLDHDLLVVSSQLEQARRVLLRLGFEDGAGAPDVFARGTVTVDLHHDPYDRSRVPSRGRVIRAEAEGVVRRAVETTVAGRPALVPCRADRMLLLCAHLVKHSFDRLIRMVDIAECWRQSPPDPEALEAQARREGTADAVYYSLAATRSRLDAPVPGGLLSRLVPPRRRWIDRAFDEILRGRTPGPFFAERLLLCQLGGFRERLAAVGEMIWTPEQQERLRKESLGGRIAAVPDRVVDLARRGLALRDR